MKFLSVLVVAVAVVVAAGDKNIDKAKDHTGSNKKSTRFLGGLLGGHSSGGVGLVGTHSVGGGLVGGHGGSFGGINHGFGVSGGLGGHHGGGLGVSGGLGGHHGGGFGVSGGLGGHHGGGFGVSGGLGGHHGGGFGVSGGLGGHHGGGFGVGGGLGGHHGGGFGPLLPSPVAPPSDCRYWCRTPKGQAYCCEDTHDPQSFVGVVKPGLCPPVRPQCPPVRSFSAPTSCSNDGACGGVDKCCFDKCLGQHTCKAPLGIGR